MNDHKRRWVSFRARNINPSDGNVAASPIVERYDNAPLRQFAGWLIAIVILFVVGFLANSIANNRNLRLAIVGKYFFSDPILSGLAVTMELSIISMLVGIIIGLILALMRKSKNKILLYVSATYLWIFRGVPELIQLIFWYNLALLFPVLAIGIPFGPTLLHISTNRAINGYTAAILGLGLGEAAYMAEIFRSGIEAVARGQHDAAAALGMSTSSTYRHIVLPQAMRTVVPPTGNQFLGMIKTTSLVSVIAGADLMTQAENIYSRNFDVVQLLTVAALWYLIITSIATIGQRYIERHFNRGIGTDN